MARVHLPAAQVSVGAPRVWARGVGGQVAERAV